MATVKELHGSGSGGGSYSAVTAVRRYFVTPYSEAGAWGQNQLERLDALTGVPYGGRQYQPNSTLFAKTFEFEPVGRPTGYDANGNIDYEGGAYVTLNFESRLATGAAAGSESPGGGGGAGDPANIPWLEESLQIGAEVLVIRKKGEDTPAVWQWNSDSKKITDADDIHLVKLMAKADWRLTRLYVPIAQYNRTAIMGAAGKVNATPFAGFASETMFFAGATADRTIQTDGTSHYRISYQFAYSEKGWNKQFRGGTTGPGGDGWDTPISVSGSAPIYQTYAIGTLIPGLS